MNENTTTTYRIYCKPKQGAQAEGHYRPEWYRTRAGAEAAIKELEEDGISVYWKLSIEDSAQSGRCPDPETTMNVYDLASGNNIPEEIRQIAIEQAMARIAEADDIIREHRTGTLQPIITMFGETISADDRAIQARRPIEGARELIALMTR